MKLKPIKIFQAPKPVPRLSQAAGFVLSTAWVGYAAFMSITENLGWPPGDEQSQIAVVAIAVFAAGWLSIPLAYQLFV